MAFNVKVVKVSVPTTNNGSQTMEQLLETAISGAAGTADAEIVYVEKRSDNRDKTTYTIWLQSL